MSVMRDAGSSRSARRSPSRRWPVNRRFAVAGFIGAPAMNFLT
jgi:hypothetical protein